MPRAREVVTADGTTANRRPVLGDMHWDGTRWRRWSGRRWAHAVYSTRPARLEVSRLFHDEPRMDDERRRRALSQAVEDQVMTNGATVVHDGRGGVVLAYRRPVSHLLHALLTVITGGLWLVVWLVVTFTNREDRILLEADPWGNVWARPVASP